MSMPVDVVIRGGHLVTEAGVQEAGLAVHGGKIVAIADSSHLPLATIDIDASGKWVIPGGIDLHVHIHEVALPHRGNFATETRAALAGGTTTIAEFVYADGEHDIRQAFVAKKQAADHLSCADFGFHALLVTQDDLRQIDWLAEAGVLSFKAIMSRVDTLPGMKTDLMREMFGRVASVHGLATVHAENDEICSTLAAEARQEGRNDPLAHARSRPSIVEEEAVSRAILLAKEAAVPLHVFHISSAAGARLIASARAQGLPVTGETCPHYLQFVEDDLIRGGPFLQVTPTIKSADDRTALWAALQNGTLQLLVSDHYAPLRKEKEPGWDDIWETEAGVPGIETRIPYLFSKGVLPGQLSIEQFVNVVSTNAARVFGLYPRKGVLRIGSDADIAVLDPDQELVVEPEILQQTADWTPFAGLTMAGWPTWVLLRGQVVVRERVVCAEVGSGQYLPRGSN